MDNTGFTLDLSELMQDNPDTSDLTIDTTIPDQSVSEPILPEAVGPIATEEPLTVPDLIEPSANSILPLVKKFLGDIKEIEVLDEETQELKKIAVDDYNWTEESFLEIVSKKIEIEKNKAAENKIDITGISDFTKRAIELEKNGVNPTELLKLRNQVIDPLEEIDLSKVEDQRKALYMKLKASKMSDSDATTVVKAHELSGTLESEAEKAVADLRVMIDNHLKQQEALEVAKKTEQDNALKDYRKAVRDVSAEYDVKDTFRNKVVDTLTKKTEKGGFAIEEEFYLALRDPKRAVKLAMLLVDEEAYDTIISTKKVEKARLDDTNTLRITGRSNQVEKLADKTNASNYGSGLVINLE